MTSENVRRRNKNKRFNHHQLSGNKTGHMPPCCPFKYETQTHSNPCPSHPPLFIFAFYASDCITAHQLLSNAMTPISTSAMLLFMSEKRPRLPPLCYLTSLPGNKAASEKSSRPRLQSPHSFIYNLKKEKEKNISFLQHNTSWFIFPSPSCPLLNQYT